MSTVAEDVLAHAVTRWPAFSDHLIGGRDEAPTCVDVWSRHADPEVRMAVAARPRSLPEDVTHRLAADPDWAVRAAVVARGRDDLPEGVLAQLSVDPNPWIAAAAKRERLSERYDQDETAHTKEKAIDEQLAAELAAQPQFVEAYHARSLRSWIRWVAPWPVHIDPGHRDVEFAWNHHWDGMTPDTPVPLLVQALTELRDVTARKVAARGADPVTWFVYFTPYDVHVVATSDGEGSHPFPKEPVWQDDLTSLVCSGLAGLVYEPCDPGFKRSARSHGDDEHRVYRERLHG